MDEAHHVFSESFQRVLAGFSGAYVGVTATPDRSDKKLPSDFFENVAHETNLVDLIRDGYLCRVRLATRGCCWVCKGIICSNPDDAKFKPDLTIPCTDCHNTELEWKYGLRLQSE